MTKVTSLRTVEFPDLDWNIEKGEEKELPEGKEAQEAILAHWAISETDGKSKSQERREVIQKDNKATVETKKENDEK